MNRRGTGAVFCLISAFLFGCQYLSTAIYASNRDVWGEGFFQELMGNLGSGLMVASIVSLILGVGYLVWAELLKEK